MGTFSANFRTATNTDGAFRRIFNRAAAIAAGVPANNPFLQQLHTTFGDKDTTRQIIGVLKNLQLPVPKKKKEFISATEGTILFSNQYGLVIRIELKEPTAQENIHRINDNPWIIQPLGSFEAGKAIIEICPGCDLWKEQKNTQNLSEDLLKTGVKFWDAGARNMGILPFKTPSFPEGVPVVIDRLAVSGLSEYPETIKAALEKIGTAQDPQQILYGALRTALKEAWPEPGKDAADAGKMKMFWDLCKEHVKKGRLIAGWNNGTGSRYSKAQKSAKSYDQKIRRALKRG